MRAGSRGAFLHHASVGDPVVRAEPLGQDAGDQDAGDQDTGDLGAGQNSHGRAPYASPADRAGLIGVLVSGIEIG